VTDDAAASVHVNFFAEVEDAVQSSTPLDPPRPLHPCATTGPTIVSMRRKPTLIEVVNRTPGPLRRSSTNSCDSGVTVITWSVDKVLTGCYAIVLRPESCLALSQRVRGDQDGTEGETWEPLGTWL
jgi:hypothetical protein